MLIRAELHDVTKGLKSYQPCLSGFFFFLNQRTLGPEYEYSKSVPAPKLIFLPEQHQSI